MRRSLWVLQTKSMAAVGRPWAEDWGLRRKGYGVPVLYVALSLRSLHLLLAFSDGLSLYSGTLSGPEFCLPEGAAGVSVEDKSRISPCRPIGLAVPALPVSDLSPCGWGQQFRPWDKMSTRGRDSRSPSGEGERLKNLGPWLAPCRAEPGRAGVEVVA